MVSRLFLVATALVFLAFGLWGLLAPSQMLGRFGVDLTDPAGKTAIRATYGGFLIAAGSIYAFCALAEERTRFGLQAVLIFSGVVLLTRVIGMVVDGSAAPLHLSYAALEVVGIGTSAALLWRGGR